MEHLWESERSRLQRENIKVLFKGSNRIQRGQSLSRTSGRSRLDKGEYNISKSLNQRVTQGWNPHRAPPGDQDYQGSGGSQDKARATYPSCNCWSLPAVDKRLVIAEEVLAGKTIAFKNLSCSEQSPGVSTYVAGTRTVPSVLPHHLTTSIL